MQAGAGWTSGQLDAEIARGDWRVMKAEARIVSRAGSGKIPP
jgi:putative AlgH/UPF0301 family transcriptional regulator